MPSAPITKAAGMFWISREDWPRYVSLCVDRDKLPATYEKWLYRTHKQIDTYKRGGWEIVRVPVDLDVFAAWCKLKGLDLNAHARLEYATEVAAAQVRARDQEKH